MKPRNGWLAEVLIFATLIAAILIGVALMVLTG